MLSKTARSWEYLLRILTCAAVITPTPNSCPSQRKRFWEKYSSSYLSSNSINRNVSTDNFITALHSPLIESSNGLFPPHAELMMLRRIFLWKVGLLGIAKKQFEGLHLAVGAAASAAQAALQRRRPLRRRLQQPPHMCERWSLVCLVLRIVSPELTKGLRRPGLTELGHMGPRPRPPTV